MAEPVSLQTLLTYLTLISVPVGVFYHIMTLRNQSRTRQAQLFMQIYNSYMDTDFADSVLDIFSRKFTTYEDWEEKYGFEANREAYRSQWIAGQYYEGIGVLVKENLVDIRLVAQLMAGSTKYYWEMFEPIIVGMREDIPGALENVEYLYKELMKYLEKHPELKA